jgi:hypothetical protein
LFRVERGWNSKILRASLPALLDRLKAQSVIGGIR